MLKNVVNFVMASGLAVVLGACAPDSKKSTEGTNGPHTGPNILCKSFDVRKFEYKNGSSYRQRGETETKAYRTRRKISDVTEEFETKGEVNQNLYEIKPDNSKELDIAVSYTYVATRKTTTVNLGDGQVTEKSTVYKREEAKDGYEFSNGDPKNPSVRERTQEVEETYVEKNGQRRTIRYVVDGKDMPVSDEVMTITEGGGVRTEHVKLLKPERMPTTDDGTMTLESSESTCKYLPGSR